MGRRGTLGPLASAMLILGMSVQSSAQAIGADPRLDNDPGADLPALIEFDSGGDDGLVIGWSRHLNDLGVFLFVPDGTPVSAWALDAAGQPEALVAVQPAMGFVVKFALEAWALQHGPTTFAFEVLLPSGEPLPIGTADVLPPSAAPAADGSDGAVITAAAGGDGETGGHLFKCDKGANKKCRLRIFLPPDGSTVVEQMLEEGEEAFVGNDHALFSTCLCTK